MKFFIFFALLTSIFIITLCTKLKRRRRHALFPRDRRCARHRRGFKRTEPHSLKKDWFNKIQETYKKRNQKLRRRKFSLTKWCKLLDVKFHICVGKWRNKRLKLLPLPEVASFLQLKGKRLWHLDKMLYPLPLAW
ncbi:uncharacterized protein LOC143449344 [Clavelina lepadiformis]|uniref:uncharacterized protein LOC143449344 n=1 Tax=Clavelina lepadiformis TaxID=159417 RepID=UPI004040F6BC